MLTAARRRLPFPAAAARFVVAGALTLVLLAGGCATNPADDTSTSPTVVPQATAPDGTSVQWVACHGGLECTTLEVPVAWDDPDGPTLSLAVARRPASSGNARGTILANPGGPGASGVTWLARTGDLVGLGADFDLVSWDPRGVGASTRVDCGDIGGPGGTGVHRAPSTGPTAAATRELVAAFVDACAQRSPDLVGRLGTREGVRDMDAVRVATGAARVDVVGFSYGTYLGLAYARAYPQRVRTLVLDAVVNPADGLEDLLGAQAVAMETALAATLGDDADLWERAGRRTDPSTLAFAAIAATYDPVSLQQLPAALQRATTGDDATLRSLADGYFAAGTYTAYLGTLCADLDRPTTTDEHAAMTERLVAVAPRLGGAIAGELAACALWPVANGTRWLPETPEGVTVVVVAGTGDLATPPGLAEAVADTLEGALLVVRDGDGHVSLRRSACVAGVITDVLGGAPAPQGPLRCGA